MEAERAKVNRRRLLGACAGVALASALPAKVAGADPTAPDPCEEPTYADSLLSHRRLGIQLYTLRDQVSSIGFAKVFERLKRIGYAEVEFAGYTQGSVGAITLPQLRQLLDDNGLRGIGAHAGLNASNVTQKLDEAEILGLPTIGNATTLSAGTLSQWQAHADLLNTVGQKAAERGIKFYWHNHATEFGFVADAPTTRIYDVLLERTDPKYVFMEMDIYWAYAGQHRYGRAPFPTFDPIDYLNAHKSRYLLFHVKDGATNALAADGYTMSDVGQGNIPFKSFFTALNDPEGRSFLQEHDGAASGPNGSWRSAVTSYGWMRHGIVR